MKLDIYKKEISNFLGCSPDKIFLYWKGRVALYAILKAIGIKKGDEVILPAFTCVVVPNAILYLGAKPVYVDICPDTYNMDVDKVRNAITENTKVIICQNTFGLSSNLERLIEIAKENKLLTIEDCTHGFSGFYKGKPNGTFCDAAFFSTQWNKPFSTGIGGILVVNNPLLYESIVRLESEKITPGFMDRISLSCLVFFHNHILNNYTYARLVRLYRFLSKFNIVVGSNQGQELSSNIKPPKYFKGQSSVQVNEGIKQLKKLDKVNKKRKLNSIAYNDVLKNSGKVFVNEEYFKDHLFLKFPIITTNKDLFLKLAEKENIPMSDWFVSPIHPILENFHIWQLCPEQYPIANEIAGKIVNLPTEIKNNKSVINFLKNNLSLIQ